MGVVGELDSVQEIVQTFVIDCEDEYVTKTLEGVDRTIYEDGSEKEVNLDESENFDLNDFLAELRKNYALSEDVLEGVIRNNEFEFSEERYQGEGVYKFLIDIGGDSETADSVLELFEGLLTDTLLDEIASNSTADFEIANIEVSSGEDFSYTIKIYLDKDTLMPIAIFEETGSEILLTYEYVGGDFDILSDAGYSTKVTTAIDVEDTATFYKY